MCNFAWGPPHDEGNRGKEVVDGGRWKETLERVAVGKHGCVES